MAAAPSSLNAARRQRELDALRGGDRRVDLLVIGGGVTGAGVALDAAARGLSVVLAEKHDLAFGTSRWSSKLVHGGLRYLATGDVATAYESAVERGILITHTAPHLVRALPNVLPLLPGVTRSRAALIRTGQRAGDVLRALAHTSSATLPRARRVTPDEVCRLAPGVRTDGLRGGLVYWDGQLADDARLVVTLARTAAAHGARVLTRCAALSATGTGATLRDELTGERFDLDARAVINATGVWAAGLAADVALRPSRGTHLVFARQVFGPLEAALTVPVPGEPSRFVFALPAPEHRVYVGLTDVEAPGEPPDVPTPDEDEVDFLLATIGSALARPLHRSDLAGTFAGLRPLLDAGPGRTADLSRRHVVNVGADGLITVVGGKLTTYRRMAEDAVDAALAHAGITAGPSRTRRLPLVGASDPRTLAACPAPARLVGKYGVAALGVLAEAGGDPQLLEPVVPSGETSMAELLYAVRHEGALDESDLLERRSRIGLSPADRERARPSAAEALLRAGL